MALFLLDTSVASILFQPAHSLFGECSNLLAGQSLLIPFMVRAELLLWPRLNNWGSKRKEELDRHISLYTTLYPDDQTCEEWAQLRAYASKRGRALQVADAWIAAAAIQWQIPLVTTNQKDFEFLPALTLLPVPSPPTSAGPSITATQS